ncbi:amidotransferase [Chromatium okenii]|uniref:glutamine amidotransferase-related protein n=1 Tax=Chromatium okenii TaxID=61644 RepID=UPI0026EBD042|nr:amidotransferase [Chromatium okenii]MBV5308747.1 amidotransferase [Chromatium okenii]
MQIQAFTHVPFEDPAAIADWAAQRGHTLNLTPFYTAAAVPELSTFDWLVIMGGPMSVNDEALYPWLAVEKQLIAAAIAANKTVVGVCLGAQLIAAALGAQVRRNPVKEIGWFPIELTAAGKQAHLFNRMPPTLPVFHWHGDTFELPQNAIQIARSAACEQQIFQYGERVIGLQCHLESTPATVAAIVAHCADELQPARFVQTEAQLLAADAVCYAEMETALFALLDQLAAV